MTKPNTGVMTVDLLWQLERIGAPALSPDGTQAVASVASFDVAANTSRASLWLFSTFGGEPRALTHCGEKDGQASWSPKGGHVAFIARREQEGRKDAAPQLYLIASDGGEAKRLTQLATGVDAYKWLPNGKGIVFVSWVYPQLKGAQAQADALKAYTERKDSAYVTEEAQYRYWDHNIAQDRVPHLHLLHLASGKVTDLFEGTEFELSRLEPDANTFDIAPDSQSLVFAFDAAPQKRGDHAKVLVHFHLKTRAGETLAQHKDWDYESPRFSPNGQTLALIASNIGKKHTAPPVLALVTLATKKLRTISAAWDRAPSAPLLWHGDDAVLFAAEEAAQNHLWLFDVAQQQAHVVARGGYLQGFDVAANVVVFAADAMDHPTRLSVLSLEGDSLCAPARIESFNDARLAGVKMGRFESVTYKGGASDGKTRDDVQMWVVYPPDFDAKKKYPLLHSIHGGPHACSADTFHYRWNNQLFAAQGYVVVGANYHGSSGFGYHFLDSITHRWGDLELQDVEAATDHLLKKPFIDKNRLFATGGSYGGYMVAWMNGHVAANRYKAYICHAGCYDWVAMFADDAWHWHAKELGAWYWDNMAQIQAQSPHAFAKNMKTPTLVIHGQLDYRVPDNQGLAYYNTLKALDVPARLVWFPDENHWILKPANAKLWYGEYFAWLARFDPALTSPKRAAATKTAPTRVKSAKK